jgi:hypothetical protein
MTVESEEHPPKHNCQSCSTEEGMEIDESDEQFRKTPGSRHESLEPDSNVTCESEEHPPKHPWQSCSTEEGMKIDESNEQF